MKCGASGRQLALRLDTTVEGPRRPGLAVRGGATGTPFASHEVRLDTSSIAPAHDPHVTSTSGRSEGEPRGDSSWAAPLFGELNERRVPYVVVRGGHLVERGGEGDVCLLVGSERVSEVRTYANGLHSAPAVDGTTGGTGDQGPPVVRVRVTGTLRYGKRICTGEPTHRLIARARARRGVLLAAPADELIDLVLHCVIEAGDFTPANKVRIRELMSDVREHPLEAGSAAIRVERELAPALRWHELLASIVEGRWDDLLSRRDPLVRRLRKRVPRGRRIRRKMREWLSAAAGWVHRLENAEDDEEAAGQHSQPARRSDAMARRQIRGSGLLLGGKGLASGLKFVAQLIVVRYLASEQYGAWTYALAVVTFLQGFSALGLSRAIARYLPLHLERGEPEKFYGVLSFVTIALLLAGGVVVVAFYIFPEQITALAGVASTEPIDLLFILIFLVPVQTVDNALTGVCAVFGDSSSIFMRRYVLSPALRIAVAGSLVIAHASVTVLAWGFLFSGVVGVVYYGWSVVGSLRENGLLHVSLVKKLRIPVREVLSYTMPVMASDWCAVFMNMSAPLLLGYFSDMSSVALYQVVVPVAALNTLVYQSFVVLFEPSASRLIAREDGAGLRKLYRRFAVWVAVLTFPPFALSFTASQTLATTLFGQRYLAAAPILSLLAVGQFATSMVGFNAATLRVTGRIRWLIGANAVAALTTVVASLALIPSMGSLGAGVATMVGLIAFTTLKQAALRVSTGVSLLSREYIAPYLTMAACFVVLLAVRVLWGGIPWITVSAALLASLAVYLSARVNLAVSHTFPELARTPLLRTLLG